jgi:hypothetical protein
MPPVHHHDVGITGRDERVSESHAGSARSDNEIVGL